MLCFCKFACNRVRQCRTEGYIMNWIIGIVVYVFAVAIILLANYAASKVSHPKRVWE